MFCVYATKQQLGSQAIKMEGYSHTHKMKRAFFWFNETNSAPFFLREVRNFLVNHYSGRWIGRDGHTAWSLR